MSVTITGTSNVVVQTKSSTLKTPFYNGVNNSFVETGLSVSITPTSSSNKIYVVATIGAASAYSASIRLHRNGSPICIGDAAGSRPQQSSRTSFYDFNHPTNMVVSYLDSPGTTAAVTYSIAGSCYGGYGFYMNRSGNDTDTADQYGGRPQSTIVAMEVTP